jgi:hypothetical protein
MTEYRAYIVGPDGHFQSFEVITAADDGTAVEVARRFVDGHDVEVWYLDRSWHCFPTKSRLRIEHLSLSFVYTFRREAEHFVSEPKRKSFIGGSIRLVGSPGKPWTHSQAAACRPSWRKSSSSSRRQKL